MFNYQFIVVNRYYLFPTLGVSQMAPCSLCSALRRNQKHKNSAKWDSATHEQSSSGQIVVWFNDTKTVCLMSLKADLVTCTLIISVMPRLHGRDKSHCVLTGQRVVMTTERFGKRKKNYNGKKQQWRYRLTGKSTKYKHDCIFGLQIHFRGRF